MDEIKNLLNGNGVNPWIYTSLVFVVCVFAGLAIRRFIWAKLTQWAARSEAEWDDELLDAISLPVTCLLLVIAFGIAGQSMPPQVRTHPLLIHGVKVAMMAIFIWALERAVSVIFKSKAVPESLGGSTRTLLLTLARVLIFFVGALIILDTLGVSITPVLASLGVGSVAVALALQDTLSNFFGGLYILVDKPIQIGDFIKVEDSEGQVEAIGWRSTRIRTGANDTVVIPNSKVSGAVLKNYDLPGSKSVLTLGCGVAYGIDLERVEKTAVAVAQDVVNRFPGADATFTPLVRFHTFADSSVNFNLVVQVQRFSEMALIRHELMKALHARFTAEGIEIPFPQRVIHWNPQALP